MNETSELKQSRRFAVRQRLGSGGTGVVYTAYDRERRQEVALKLLHTTDASALYRFKKEFRTIADVAHPNLVNLYELVVEDDQWFFTMELVEGRSFFDFVRPRAASEASEAPRSEQKEVGGKLHTQRLRRVLGQLVAGVRALHDAGKLHRDLKPSNVMVTREGRLVILDFGLATELAPDRQTVDSGLAGTAAYMAPEQAKAESATAASDWYAVGVILFQALTGRLPFTGSLYDVLVGKQEKAAPSPTDFVDGLPEDLVTLCEGMLASAPEDRPSGAEIVEQLGGSVDESTTSAIPVVRDGLLVGRRLQLAQLDDAFESSCQGRATSIYVHGPSGMGKTTLIRHFLATLSRHRSAVVLRGRCYEREMVPYKAIDGVIDSLSRHLTTLDERQVRRLLPADVHPLLRLFPVLRRIFPFSRAPRQRRDSPDLLTLRRRAFEALRELLAGLAELAPLVLFIDDLQWADADSTALLEDLLRPPDPPPLLLVASFRSEEIEKQPFLQELLDHTDGESRRRLKIGALTDGEARELATSILADDALTEPVLEAILKEAEGSPFLVEQLARYVQIKPDALRTGLSLLEMLEERLLQLPAGARPLVLTMTVANRPLDAGVAYQAAGLEGDERSLIARLRAAHFIRSSGSAERVELYHDRIREALSTLIDALETQRIHRRMAGALESRGFDDPEALFEHYLGAGDVVSASRQAVLAAEKAFSALAFDPAARFYQRALELEEAGGEPRVELQRGLARSLANAGRCEASALVYLDLARSAAAESLEARCRAAEQYLLGGHLDRGLAVGREVLAKVGLAMARGRRRALMSLLFNRLRLRLRGLRFTERAPHDVEPQDLVRIDTCWAVGNGLSLVDPVQGSDFQTRHLLLALKAGEPYRVARALAMEGSFAASTGTARRAREIQEHAMALARKVDHPHAIGLATMAAGFAGYFNGQWRDAAESLDQADALFSDRCSGVVWETTMCRRFSLGSLMYLGEIAELCRRVPLYLAEAKERGNTYLGNTARSRLNLVWLAADDPDTARRQLDRSRSTELPGQFTVGRFNELIARVQADLYCGDARAAAERLQETWPALEKSLLQRVKLVRVEALQALGRCALARAALAGGDAALLGVASQAAARIKANGWPWSDPLATLLGAGVAHVQGDADGCRFKLRAAARGFDAADMALYAAAARRRLGEATGDRGLVEEANAWMRAQKIIHPGRMTEMLAPGF